MQIIDFHNHFYPQAYLDALRSGSSRVRVTVDADGNPVLHYPGDYNIAVRGHRDIAYRETVLKELGVDTQILSLTTPGTHVEEPAMAVKLARMVNGVVERFPRIKWALGHLGGAIPYLVERLDRGFHAFKECRANIDRPPSEYLKEFYYDSVNFDDRALRLAIEFAGADHILAGSDYPHQIGSLQKMLDSIAALDLSEDDRAAILGGNAARLLLRD